MSTSTIQQQTASASRPYFVLLGLPIGFPQIIAGMLLLFFAAQTVWVAVRTRLRENEVAEIQWGKELLGERRFQPEAGRSPMIAVLAGVAAFSSDRFGRGLGRSATDEHGSETRATQSTVDSRRSAAQNLGARVPVIAIGLLLGASVWYVARRLYGNAGGYIALSLYAFSPVIVTRAASIQAAIVAAWGAFGLVFTSIAVSHTLYAPREVVLWNWKRIALMGLSIALAIGSHWATAAVVVLAFGFMLYLAPERRGAAAVIMAAACVLALVLLVASYGFDLHAIAAAVGTLRRADFAPQLLARGATYNVLGRFFTRAPAVMVALVGALLTYAVWKRPRFFGVNAPLVAFGVVLLLGITLPHLGGYDLFVAALPFAFVFIAGVCADLLETAYASLVGGVIAGLIVASAAMGLVGVLRL